MADDAAEVRLILNAIDNASKTISGVTGKLSTFSKIAKGGQDMAAGLGINLNALSNPAMAAGQGIKMVADYIKGAMDDTMAYTQAVKEMSMSFAAAPEEISRMIQAGDDMGVTMEEMRASMQFMNRNGLAPTIENLAALADRTNLILDPTQRADELVKLLGRSYTKLDPLLKQGGDGIRALAAAQSDALVVTQAEIDASERNRVAMDTWEDSLQSLKYTVGNQVIPVMTEFLNILNMTAVSEGAKEATDAWDEFFKQEIAQGKTATQIAEDYKNKQIELKAVLESGIDDAGLLKYFGTFQQYRPALEAATENTQDFARAVLKASGSYEEYVQVITGGDKMMPHMTEQAWNAAKGLNAIADAGVNVSGVMMDQYNYAMGQAEQASKDQAQAARDQAQAARDQVTANEAMFDSINTGLDSMIENFMGDMEWLKGGGLELQKEFEKVRDAWIQDPGDAALKQQMEDVYIKTEALKVALGTIDATQAGENIAEMLGIPIGEAMAKLYVVQSTLLALDGTRVTIDIMANIPPELQAILAGQGYGSTTTSPGGTTTNPTPAPAPAPTPGTPPPVRPPPPPPENYALGGSVYANAMAVWNEPGYRGEMLVTPSGGTIVSAADIKAALSGSGGGGFNLYGDVNIYAAPGQNGAQLYDEFVREARKRQNSGAATAGSL